MFDKCERAGCKELGGGLLVALDHVTINLCRRCREEFTNDPAAIALYEDGTRVDGDKARTLALIQYGGADYGGLHKDAVEAMILLRGKYRGFVREWLAKPRAPDAVGQPSDLSVTAT